MSAPSFDLTREPWIPVSLPNGETTEWGLRELFARAHEASGLAISSAVTYNAVLRYLLAIAHRAYEGPASPKAWLDIWKPQHFDAARLDEYLDRYQYRFDLFHEEYPFAQVQKRASIRNPKPGGKQNETLLGAPKPLMQMEPERTDNKTLARHQRNDRAPSFSAAEATRMLLVQQAYALGGGNSYPFRRAESPLIAGYSVLIDGHTLFQTICLNLNGYSPQGDAPWWEWEGLDVEPAEQGSDPRGLTDLLTWRSRQILLAPNPDGSVAWYFMQQGYKLPSGTLVDPFMALRQLKDERWIGMRFDEARALWRDSHALIESQRASTDDSSGSTHTRRPDIIEWRATIEEFALVAGTEATLPPLKMRVCGANKSAGGGNFAFIRMEQLSIPTRLILDPELAEVVHLALDRAERTKWALDGALKVFVWTYLSGASALDRGEGVPDALRVDDDDFSRMLSTLNTSERYWASLEQGFQTFLNGLVSTGSGPAQLAWYTHLRSTATDALRTSVRGSTVDPRRMRAGILAERALGRRLGDLSKLIRELDPSDTQSEFAVEATTP
jgi:CRISPR system Cascade subunit CasA